MSEHGVPCRQPDGRSRSDRGRTEDGSEAGERQADQNNRAWLLVLPVVVSVAFSAIIPLMTVVNYSVQDILEPERRGSSSALEWFRQVLRDPELHGRVRAPAPSSRPQVLLIEIPLGIALALAMPARGVAGLGGAGAARAAAADPVERGRHHLADLRPRRHRPAAAGPSTALGIDYNYTADATDAWLTVLVMDVWHWTPLVALLCYAGLRAIPDAYYQAAAHRRRLGAGPCSATSSCPSCAAC